MWFLGNMNFEGLGGQDLMIFDVGDFRLFEKHLQFRIFHCEALTNSKHSFCASVEGCIEVEMRKKSE